jgi:hypothetical protein
LAGPAYGHRNRRLASRRVASAPHVGVDQGGLVTPVDLRPLGPGALLDSRVLTLKPVLHRLGALLVSALDRLLRREAPSSEVLADAAHLELDAEFLLDELAYGSTTPQAKVHLQLLGSLVNDQALNDFFLHRTEHPTITSAASSQCWFYSGPATCMKQINGRTNGRVTQSRHCHDLHDLDALLVQPYDLLSPFM